MFNKMLRERIEELEEFLGVFYNEKGKWMLHELKADGLLEEINDRLKALEDKAGIIRDKPLN